MKQKVILLASHTLGKGSEELGETILETFFTLLKQRESLPYAVFCMNSGVKALTDASFASVHLKELEQQGVRVIACKTCVDYYELSESLTVGQIGSMADFIQLASEYEVLTLS
ncbi:DsrE family protein [Paenibacillus sp. N1-5-1-14]|uniref:DsrE family protein n=1 Tax=Paenibacillus radicibacter TaxID=2972488 RepID=UPI0021599045|nr:DsrE family protein [Paenibacillus radicibacter]MCR8642651.1 DsrE family protein [Paenibacillus radicibacter]